MVNLGKVSFTANPAGEARANPTPQGVFPQNAQPARQPRAQQAQANPAPIQQQPRIDAPTKAELERQLQLVNKVVGGLNVNLSFGVLESTGDIFVQVKDNNTGKTIRVMPSVDFLRLQDKLAHLGNNAKGFLQNRLA